MSPPTLAEISKQIKFLEATISPLQEELSKLKSQRAGIENSRKRKSKSSRNAEIGLAYGFLTGMKSTRNWPLRSMYRACINLGIKNPPPNLTRGQAMTRLAFVVKLTKTRIAQIVDVELENLRLKTNKSLKRKEN